jgi:hypothetical protein
MCVGRWIEAGGRDPVVDVLPRCGDQSCERLASRERDHGYLPDSNGHYVENFQEVTMPLSRRTVVDVAIGVSSFQRSLSEIGYWVH